MKYFILLLVGVLGACHSSPTNRQIVSVNQHQLSCEVAQSQDQLATGLMHRKFLAQNQGMLFKFSQPYSWPFWMKNTLIPLDIIWLDTNKKVVYIEKNVPPCPKQAKHCPTYAPPAETNSQYVLEINAGQSDLLGVKLNQLLEF